jgi:hypothetical protein
VNSTPTPPRQKETRSSITVGREAKTVPIAPPDLVDTFDDIG